MQAFIAPAKSNTPGCDKSAMQDEYGQLDCTGEMYTSYNFLLESGQILAEASTCYNCYGQLSAAKDNVIVVCHALTGNSRLDQWWGEMLGPGKPFDTTKYFIICANVLGSCYGSTGPQSINPNTGTAYGISFPKITIRDSVRLHMEMLQRQLQIPYVHAVIGGSMGGMQTLEWTLLGRNYVHSAVIIGCGARHSAWQIGIGHTQRQAIYNDPKWKNGNVDVSDPPVQGLSLARQIAMISYRTDLSFEQKFGREINPVSNLYQVENYLEYQGKKFLSRFDAVTYVKLTELMDTHDITSYPADPLRVLNDIMKTLATITCPVLIMGISTDVLYPLSEQKQLAEGLPNGRFVVIDSMNGHDGFLLEQNQVGCAIYQFLEDIERDETKALLTEDAMGASEEYK